MVANLIGADGTEEIEVATPFLLAPDLDHPMAQTIGLLCFQTSVEVDPDNVVSLASLAKAHLTLGDPVPALEALREATRVKPYGAVLHFQRAQIHAQLEQIPQAIEALEEGLKYAPNDQAARALLEQLRTPSP